MTRCSVSTIACPVADSGGPARPSMRRVFAGVAVFFLFAFLLLPQAARADDPRAVGGMIAWPRAEMARALDIFVPERMKALGVPGASIAIVADGRIVFAGTFGKAGDASGAPVTLATLFEAGEIGETVAAYGALGMVRDKLLFLDAPLSRDLQARWLRKAADDREITLRRVLTHSSGLADNLAHPSRRTNFTPGSRFSHSGVGFMYLQHAMSQMEEQPFEQIMKARVFIPLGMTHSTYETGGHGPEARGHVPLSFVLSAFYFTFAAAFAVGMLIIWAVLRFLVQRHRLEPRDALWPALGGVAISAGFIWYGMGFRDGLFIVGIALAYALAMAAVAALAHLAARAIEALRARDGMIARGYEPSRRWVTNFMIAAVLAATWPALGFMTGVPGSGFLPESMEVNAAKSFHTTAPDMAQFMIEIMDGRHMGDAMRARMTGERIAISPTLAWGLGIGIRQDAEGETLWVRGSTLGFESLMVMDPARRAGVIVLTNSREGAELAQEVARNALGFDGVWTLR